MYVFVFIDFFEVFYYNNLFLMIFGLNRNFDISKNSMCIYLIFYCLELIVDCL